MRRRLLLAITSVCVPLALWAVLPLGSGAAPLSERIAKDRRVIERKKGRERNLTADIASYSRRIGTLQGDITVLQARQARIQGDLDAKRAELAEIQADLRAERARLARLRARLAEARAALSGRMIELYKADKPDVVTVVLEADGFADLLARTEFMTRVTKQDARIIAIVRAARLDAARTAKRLDRLEARGQRVAAAILARRDEVAAIKEQLVERRDSYAAVRSSRRETLVAVRSSRKEVEAHLAGLQKEQAAVRARLAKSAGLAGAGPIKRGSGRLIYPASGPISSPFGMRWGRLHAGIDIPLAVGTPLRAADGGRVAIAGFTGGYGNYTCIQHGSSLSTCYGHQSSIRVSVGQNVSQGQVIGASGNTGNSTGPHLHFEVRVGGSPVNPMGYL